MQLKVYLEKLGLPYYSDNSFLNQQVERFAIFSKESSKNRAGTVFISDNLTKTKGDLPVIYISNQHTDVRPSIKTKLTLSILCQRLNEIAQDYNEWYLALVNLLKSNAKLEQSLALINKKLPNPIIIFDLSLKILAFSPFFDVSNDIDWQTGLKEGYVQLSSARSQKLTQVFESSMYDQKGHTHEIPLFDDQFYARGLFHNRKSFGVFAMVAQRGPIDNLTLAILAEILPLIEVQVYLKQADNFSSSKSLEFLLKDLLTNTRISETEIDKRLRFEQEKIRMPFVVISIKVKDAFTYKAPVSAILNRYVNFIYQSSHIFLIDHYYSKQRKQVFQVITDYINKYHANAAMSDVHQHLLSFKDAFEETQRTIFIHQNDTSDSLLDYRQDKVEDFFNQVVTQLPFKRYLYQPLVQLKSENNEWFHTLVMYCQNQNQQKRTALLLHIHRTTLMYRLNRIQEIYDITYEDPKIAFQITMTAKLMVAYSLMTDSNCDSVNEQGEE